jgi:hypothetical protein
MLADLPQSALHRVVECLDGPGSAAALAATCTDTLALAGERLSRERGAWNDLLSRAGQPVSTVRAGSKLDDALCRFALSGEKTVDLPDLAPEERKWLHTRAESLGLVSRTRNRSRSRRGTLRLTKPQGWALPADPLTPPTSRAPTSRAATSRAARMASWTAACEGCFRHLDAYDALYHHSGMGPMCDECIGADPDLEELKWEAKADFWR